MLKAVFEYFFNLYVEFLVLIADAADYVFKGIYWLFYKKRDDAEWQEKLKHSTLIPCGENEYYLVDNSKPELIAELQAALASRSAKKNAAHVEKIEKIEPAEIQQKAEETAPAAAPAEPWIKVDVRQEPPAADKECGVLKIHIDISIENLSPQVTSK